jgi:TonB family protein
MAAVRYAVGMRPSMTLFLLLPALVCRPVILRGQNPQALPAGPAPAPLVLPKSGGPITLYATKPSDVPPPAPPPTEEESWCSTPSDDGYVVSKQMSPAEKKEMDLYQRTVTQQIYANWKVPRAANDPWVRAATLRIRFLIQRDGSIVDPMIMMGSGRRDFDASALNSVKKASPFVPVPAAVPVPVKFCARFNYNKDQFPNDKPLDPFAKKTSK